MVRRRKMTAQEMEKWLLSQGAIAVTEEMKKEPWSTKIRSTKKLHLRSNSIDCRINSSLTTCKQHHRLDV